MSLLVVLGRFTAFADVFLSGLVWACAAAAFALLQFSSDLSLLILARALQGFAAAAFTGASSGLLATAAITEIRWLSPAFLQSTAMATAPLIAGYLHDHYSPDALFYFAYAIIAFDMLLVLMVASVTLINGTGSTDETTGLLESETLQGGSYGTIASASGTHSRRSSRSISPTSIPAELSQPNPSGALTAAAIWNRLSVALGGYLVVGLIASALQSVLPLFVQRHFDWSVLESGYMFVPLSAPAAVAGLLSGTLAKHVPKSTRFLTTSGFLALLPAFLYLGQLKDNTQLVQHAFLLTLSGISLATGLCGDPLSKEIASVLGSSTPDSSSATAQATVLLSVTNAWGSLAGPLFAGAVSYLWGWQTMTKSLAVLAAATGVTSLLFLQGWIGNPFPETRTRRLGPASDEESAPFLANDRSNGGPHEHAEGYGNKEDRYARRQGSDDVSPHTRSDGDRKPRSQRRHFSVDNFSVATTAGPGSIDSSTSSVRFQASLETPHPAASTATNQQQHLPPTISHLHHHHHGPRTTIRHARSPPRTRNGPAARRRQPDGGGWRGRWGTGGRGHAVHVTEEVEGGGWGVRGLRRWRRGGMWWLWWRVRNMRRSEGGKGGEGGCGDEGGAGGRC
ncbi:hypothetical protein CHGG_06107 [Chaetomium globosum CBS 148.51]|uniref:Major facilitator superfamily (MFS) profile domain-containing protein n=1 Tax=Chaetomium globosum (strain ATCC 6205 / CBS 148.51 / DSM 1962 / NBRC 6347 / NRRL 1970) TaxID=306901 RepID=Q2H5F8_CHAGB|nr:uncharacterized protein CHGG_06107 [Chaetomium globosum CBS 148.51]EAQ89488.1 hypothetical protein CHGG_06107 [Chaetomium globosum CBS 148.51]